MVPFYLNPKFWLLCILVTIAGLLYWRGGSGAREESRELRSEVKATEKSNEISRGTQQRIGTEQHEVQRKSESRVSVVQDRIDSRPGDSQLDADVLHESREAWAAAIRSSCRVQRTSDCAEAEPSP